VQGKGLLISTGCPDKGMSMSGEYDYFLDSFKRRRFIRSHSYGFTDEGNEPRNDSPVRVQSSLIDRIPVILKTSLFRKNFSTIIALCACMALLVAFAFGK
jgi:hypothetical protein